MQGVIDIFKGENEISLSFEEIYNIIKERQYFVKLNGYLWIKNIFEVYGYLETILDYI